MVRLIAGGMSQSQAHKAAGFSGSRSSASQMANRPAFRRRLREIREEIAKRPASRFVPDRDVTLSMLAAMIARAIDRDDRALGVQAAGGAAKSGVSPQDRGGCMQGTLYESASRDRGRVRRPPCIVSGDEELHKAQAIDGGGVTSRCWQEVCFLLVRLGSCMALPRPCSKVRTAVRAGWR